VDGGDSDEGSPGGCAKAELATARKTSVTEAGFLYSDQKSTAEKGSSKVPAEEVEGGERM